MRTFLLIGGGTIVALIAVVLVVGYRLPVEHVAAVAATYPQPPEVVFGLISDFEAMPGWRPGVNEIRRGPDRNGHPVWVEVGRTGPMPMEVERVDAPRLLITTIVDSGLPFGGSWTYEVDGTSDGGSRLTITERGKVYNPVFRFVSRFVIGHHATATNYLRHLGRRLGAETEPEPVRRTGEL